MKRIILYILLLIPLYIYPQFFQTGVQPEIPPLPESTVFRNYTGYTPSLNTGAINVPISLYEITVNNFTLPLSLQYYTTGIKVEDVADPVGYGWSLNPGLRITRTIRGRPDEAFEKKWRSSVFWGEPYYAFLYGKRALCEYPSRTQEDIDFDIIIGTNTVVDTQYDIFTMNLPSGNYSFIYEGADRIRSLNPYIKIKVIQDSHLILGFEVVDDKGITYYFGCYKGESNSTTPLYVEQPSYSKGYYTAWALRKIKLPDGKNEINITWTKASTRAYMSQPYFTKSICIEEKTPANGFDCGDSDNRGIDLYPEEGLYEPNAEYSLRVQNIQFPLGMITFSYFNQNYKSILSSINIKDINNNSIKDINFEYDTNSTLLLTELSLSNEGVYKFSYNPKRFSSILSQDYWGYYNGKSNTTLIPKFIVKLKHHIYDRIVEMEHLLGNADRSIDIDCMQANILKRVEYPTGGYTEFEYEPHEFQEPPSLNITNVTPLTKGKGLRIKKITTKEDNLSQPITKTYKYYNPLVCYDKTLDSFLDKYVTTYIPQTPSGGNQTELLAGRRVELYTKSFYSSMFISTPLISYGLVEEYINDNHKISYEFLNFGFDDIRLEPRPYVASYKNLTGNSRPLNRQISYKKEGQHFIPVEEINSIYEIASLSYHDTYVGIQFLFPQGEYSGHFLKYDDVIGKNSIPYCERTRLTENAYYIFDTNIEFKDTYLKEERKVLYTENQTVEEKTNYKGYILPTEKKFLSSDNEVVEENYTYWRDTSYPYIITRTLNGKTEYKQLEYDYGNKFQLQNIKLYKDQSEQWNEQRVTYHNYSEYGKPVYVTQDDGTTVVYIWSYKGQYPVAEIKNATYSEVKEIIPETTLKSIADATMPTTDQLNQINGLRLQLPNAHISTYTYKPLVGMISATDPSGFTTYYSYHSDGRLSEAYIIRDKTKISLEKYEYRFKE
jgi:YD repeat-containing protein